MTPLDELIEPGDHLGLPHWIEHIFDYATVPRH